VSRVIGELKTDLRDVGKRFQIALNESESVNLEPLDPDSCPKPRSAWACRRPSNRA